MPLTKQELETRLENLNAQIVETQKQMFILEGARQMTVGLIEFCDKPEPKAESDSHPQDATTEKQ